MLRIQATRFGGPDVLVAGVAPSPVAGPGQVVVDVAVADTLHLDTVMRRGVFPYPVVQPPYVPGGGVAGEVVSLGPGADRELLGRRVAARTGAGDPRTEVETVAERARRDSHTGGYAERAVVPAAALVAVPAQVGLPEAAALVNDGMTAMLLLEVARIRHGDRVLVTPAGGGVGNLLVQLAHRAGAQVIAAARGEHKLERARDNGADATIDYERENLAERIQVLTGGHGTDVALDGVGGRVGADALRATARGGRFVAYGAPSGEFTRIDPRYAEQQGVEAVSLPEVRTPAGGDTRLTGLALAESAAGRITPLVGQKFPLERAAAAHAAIEARSVIGKTLLLAPGHSARLR